jgi:hypothetical protein
VCLKNKNATNKGDHGFDGIGQAMSNLEESSARRKESRQYGTNVFAKQSLAGTNYSADKMQLFVSFGVPPALRNEPRFLE